MDDTQHPRADHPLDPLSADEVTAVATAVASSDGYAAQSERCRFVTIDLAEPHKDALLAWEQGGETPPREAEVVLLDRGRAETVEAVVSLDSGVVSRWHVRDDVQPMAVVSELMEAEELLRLHPEFQAVLARRGVTDPDQIQVDAWPAGHFGQAEESERRLARCVAFVKPAAGDNEWAHPVDGVIALVDLNTLEVLRIEDHGVVPVPAESGNFDVAAGAPLRADIAPLEITQPQGAGFTVEGRVVSWQRWQLHVGFTAREGLVLNRVSYEDGGRRRSIMHRASVSEMVVPYGDPSPTHYFKNAFDAGENGIGVAASPLTRGCDCLGEIVYLDAVVNDAAGDPVTIRNAICMHEEDHGVLWRHIEWRDGSGEVRRSRRLVISSFSAIGNYDYGFFWYLYQDGTIAYEVKLTGVLSTGAIAPGERPACDPDTARWSRPA
jgi:primary-amine oxidase